MTITDVRGVGGAGRPAGDIAMVVSAIGLFQVGAAIATQLLDDVGASGTVLVRSTLAALILIVAVRPPLRRRSAWRAVLPYGVALGTMNLSFYLALTRLELSVAVAIEFLGPLAVATVWARRPRDRSWVLIAALGVILLTRPWSVDGADPLGVGCALLAAVAWAAYILKGASAAHQLEGLAPVAMGTAIAAALVCVPGLATGGSNLLHPHVLVLGMATALVGSVIPYSLEQLALRRIAAGTFGILLALEPAVAAIVGWLILSETLPLVSIAGVVLVVSAGVAVTRAQRRPTDAPTPVADPDDVPPHDD